MMRSVRLTAFAGCLAVLVASTIAKVSYEGFQVLTTLANDLSDIEFIQALQRPGKQDIWNDEGVGNFPAPITFHVHPGLVDDVKMRLADRHMAYQVTTENLQREIDIESAMNSGPRRANDTFTYYHTFAEIMLYLEEQVTRCGSRCSLIDIGSSYEGRPLRLIKITGAANACQQKPTMWVDAGIHSREWISHSTNMYLIDRLIGEYDTDAFVKHMVDTYDWYLLPVLNPDGYEYTWNTNRMWRKSRQPVAGSLCIGADINRNFDFQWMTVGASSDPCSETYAGPRAYSEPEAKAVSDFVMTLNGAWDLFLTLHTYGQLWMSPWGYTTTLPPNYPELERVGRAGVQAIFDTHGEVYTFGSASNILYLSSGTSRDWAAGVPTIHYVYTIELRNLNSFVLPPSQILPTGEEIWAALKVTVEKMQENRPGECVP